MSNITDAEEALHARIIQLEDVLRQYKNQYCEGICDDLPNNAKIIDCGGCLARQALETT